MISISIFQCPLSGGLVFMTDVFNDKEIFFLTDDG